MIDPYVAISSCFCYIGFENNAGSSSVLPVLMIIIFILLLLLCICLVYFSHILTGQLVAIGSCSLIGRITH